MCANACNKTAILMACREERPFVSRTSMERVLRTNLEKGRLPHLLFDAGESRGIEFLNHAVQTLQKMPVADRLLASEQVQSRFLKTALAKVKSPT